MASPITVRRAFAGGTTSVEAKRAADAYIFGYPLVLMDATCRVMTAVASPNGSRAPLNQLAHRRTFPDPSSNHIVTPNADTLYSIAWLDLAAEPVVLSIPAMGDRYYVMQLLDAWTNVFASLGSRTTGGATRDFAIVGPWWSGVVPPELKQLRAPTNRVWLIGRIETDGPSDYPAVHALQNQCTLTPLTSWPSKRGELESIRIDPSADTRSTPVEQVARMDATTFFDRLNALMAGNPPGAADLPALDDFASIGVAPGLAFHGDRSESAIAAGVSAARDHLIAAAARQQGERVNGWTISPTNMGRFGTDYLQRAVVALLGLGANLREDAMYAHATVDARGEPLNGEHRYVVRFAKGVVPPVRGFWSITMYDSRRRFAENVLDRYAIGDRSNLTFGNDGTLTLYIQHQSPGIAHSSNWLPAPNGPFSLIMRLYWPAKPILDGAWKPPVVQRVDDNDAATVPLGMQV